MSESDDVTRDTKGRWKPGTRTPNPKGRPSKPIEMHYLRAVRDLCTPDDWRRIVQTAVSCAIDGDAKARDWLSRYLVGADGGTGQGANLVALAALELTGHHPVVDKLAEARADGLRYEHWGDMLDAIADEYGLQNGLDDNDDST